MVEPEQVEKLRTLLRALTPKANDPEGLAQLLALSEEWHDMIADQARALNAEGYSWTAISKPLGVNRRTAWWRYGPSRRAATTDWDAAKDAWNAAVFGRAGREDG